MSGYSLPSPGPGFPKIRWWQRPDGRYVAEWVVKLVPTAPSPVPLALALTNGVDIEIMATPDSGLILRLVSDAKSLRPDVYSVFYQLIRPAFEQGLIASVEGGDLDAHRYIVLGTAPLGG